MYFIIKSRNDLFYTHFREKPIINSKTINLNELKKLPEGTLGRTYVDWLKPNVGGI